jgi:Domain of unknown function (DUF4351)
MRVAVLIAFGASEAIELADKIKALSVEQVEALGERLLDFHGGGANKPGFDVSLSKTKISSKLVEKNDCRMHGYSANHYIKSRDLKNFDLGSMLN